MFWALLLITIVWVSWRRFSTSDDSSSIAVQDPPVQKTQNVYITWDRFEVDRWVAAWLIKRFVDQSAEFKVVPTGLPVDEQNGIAFDIPGGRWCRGPNSSASEKVFAEINTDDRAMKKMLGLVRKLELAYWRLSAKDSEARRLHDSLLRIYQGIHDQNQRTEAMFEYLDEVYETGGVVK